MDTIIARSVLAESLCDVTNHGKVWLLLNNDMRKQWLQQADLIIKELERFGHVVVHNTVA